MMQRASPPGVNIVRTRRGVRLVQDDAVLSEILSRPGPTHGVFDVLAACLATAPGPRCVILGFAGGGVMAPLRAMGYPHAVEAVDQSLAGERVFRELTGAWAGVVTLHQAEAVAWLRGRRRRFDVILEDLSVPSAEGVIKPDAAIEELPDLMRRRLTPGGIAVANLLPRNGISWKEVLRRFSRRYLHGRLVLLDDYQNRIFLGGERLESAASLSRRLRASLRRIGSRQAEEISVRTSG